MKCEMNLLPVVPVKKKRENQSPNKALLVITGLLLVVLAFYGGLAVLNHACQNEIEQMEAIIKTKSDDQVVYSNLAHQKEVLKHRRLLLESICDGKELPLKTMVEIQQALPVGVRLSNYDFREGWLVISGETQKKEEILEFKEKLADRDIFEKINMVNTGTKAEIPIDNKQDSGEDIWGFTFSIQVAEV